MAIKKGELPRLECFHNGIILIVICFRIVNLLAFFLNPTKNDKFLLALISLFNTNKLIPQKNENNSRIRPWHQLYRMGTY